MFDFANLGDIVLYVLPKLLAGFLMMLVYIHLSGKGALAPVSAIDQVGNVALGAIIGGTLFNKGETVLGLVAVVGFWAGLLLLLTVLPASAETLYNQPPFSEKELNQFIADLPRFRAWIKTNKEKAHPIVNEAGEPDFLYSKNAAGYIEAAGWKPERFFCIMGRAAAAVTKEPPVEMPNVSDDELDVVRRNLPGLLKAISPAPTPKK
mgnify:CR=1 FL=1